MILGYNEYMGGVDLFDAIVACYRIPFRMKKWWFPFYSWSLSVSAVNAWRLRMNIKNQKEPFLDFLRELVIEMMSTHGHPPIRRPSLPGPTQSDLRYDGLNHWIQFLEKAESGKHKRRNCKLCYETLKKELKCSYSCEKCNVALHIECFKEKLL